MKSSAMAGILELPFSSKMSCIVTINALVNTSSVSFILATSSLSRSRKINPSLAVRRDGL